MAHVQRKSTVKGLRRYEVRWREPDGSQRTKGGFRTKAEADDFALSIESSLRRGMYRDPKAGDVLFRDVAAQWLGGRSDLKQRTPTGYANALGKGKDLGRRRAHRR